MKTKIRFIESLEEKNFAEPNEEVTYFGETNFRIIFRKKNIFSFSKSWGLFDRNFLKLHRAQVTNFPERNF